MHRHFGFQQEGWHTSFGKTTGQCRACPCVDRWCCSNRAEKVLIAESPDGNYSRRKNAGLMPGRGATRRSGRTWHLDLRHHARWLPDCRLLPANLL